MANHKDAAKRATQALRRRSRNRAYRTRMRNAIAQLRTSVTSAEQDQVQSEFRTAVSVIQHLVAKGVIHRNQGARRVARLAKAVKGAEALKATKAAAPKAKAKKAAAKPRTKK